MKKCNVNIEAFFGIPFDYENWYEDMEIELTDEQFERYLKMLEKWKQSDEWKKWDMENGEDFFIHRDLPDIYQIIQSRLQVYAPQVWDERIIPYLDQINIFTSNEMWESCPSYKAEMIEQLTIPVSLRKIEEENDVKILLAVESGSRAWGFESKDSDWDVRFIYVHHPEWYFKVNKQPDVIERMYNDEVDMVGWELRKALSLLKKSNTSMLEWLNSPKIYMIDADFAERIRQIESKYFNPTRAMYHYNHIYNKHNERYLQREDCNMKRFLYYLRGVLACRWIEQRKTLPPVAFEELVDVVVDDASIREAIRSLIEIKKSGTECSIAVVDQGLMTYARRLADDYNKIVNEFRPLIEKPTDDALDAILFDMSQASVRGKR